MAALLMFLGPGWDPRMSLQACGMLCRAPEHTVLFCLVSQFMLLEWMWGVECGWEPHKFL